MTSNSFWVGMAMGVAAGTCLGMRMKSQERMIRRGIHHTARRMEQAFDTMMG